MVKRNLTGDYFYAKIIRDVRNHQEKAVNPAIKSGVKKAVNPAIKSGVKKDRLEVFSNLFVYYEFLFDMLLVIYYNFIIVQRKKVIV